MTIYLFGEMMLDVVAVTDEDHVAFGSDTLSKNEFHGGGSAANTASWLGALRATPVFIGTCGRDPEGDRLIAELENGGVRTIIGRSEIETGSVVSIVSRGGQRSMFPYKGANVDIKADLLPALSANDILYIASYSLFAEGSRIETLKALSLARSAGATTAIDAASSALIRKYGIPEFLSWIKGCDILFLNRDEAEAITESSDLHSAATQLSQYANYVVIKDGAQGSFALHEGRVHHQQALPANVIDTTGAGDAYAGGFLAHWSLTPDLEGCLRTGAEVASRAISQVGARPPRS